MMSGTCCYHISTAVAFVRRNYFVWAPQLMGAKLVHKACAGGQL